MLPSTQATSRIQLTLAFDPTPSPEEVFARVFRRLGFKYPVKTFKVAFHPYANLRSTIRLTNHGIQARLSDVAASAPVIVLEALAEVLLASLFRRKPSPQARECYMAWTFDPEVRGRVDANRRKRGFKLMQPPQGQHYDLEEIFQRLNRDHFQDFLPLPRLGWSPEHSITLLGHHDAAHGTITISRMLDSPTVPLEVVEYLVYHEMLHMVYPVQRKGHRRVIHSREFQESERRFPNYRSVQQTLKTILKRSHWQERRPVRRKRRRV
ncbi:MAG TPA: M48 family peptidase [Terriglobia bacterium]|nr:M48 family peptidase [Terriglobia bacterium]